ncbi:MAG: hypothetical protein K0S01_2746 [Herbinix sp.]|jgi:hypothetical protein|nr:hypothetical protein [Herbinix sp.]
MTHTTENLIKELCDVIDSNKYLILSGGTAVGKSYIANEITNICQLPQYQSQGCIASPEVGYKIEKEIVQIYPSYSYEDFVAGMSLDTNVDGFSFEYHDKIFLSILKKANKSWEKKEGKKYFLILEDIGRGYISGILGDVLPLLEPHGNEKFIITSQNGTKLSIPPNIYIIATLCTTVDSVEQMNYGFFRHFYHQIIESDYHYMSDVATEAYGDYDISSNAMFYRSKRVVLENLRYRNQISQFDREKYVIGHGVFRHDGITQVMRHQVIPTLRQYIKDGIVDKSAKAGIDILEHLANGKYSKDLALADNHSICEYRTNVTPDIFYEENLTHRPIVNLVARIKTQGLVCDIDIIDTILLNPGILVRKSSKLDGRDRTFSTPGYLYVKRVDRDEYSYGTTKKADGTPKNPRYFYSSNKADILKINGVEYVSASEMQPKEYTRWSEDLNDDNYINERASSSPNSIMFRILRSYYKCINQNYSEYLSDFPNDNNIRILREFAKAEYEDFLQYVRQIGSGSDEADVNLERNRQFREKIKGLKLFWADIGATITWNGQTIKVEGVYKVSTTEKYKEYADAMENLHIHQMIMQGPPGTSKTYSSREFLKFIGEKEESAEYLSDDELDSMQITSYAEGIPITAWEKMNPGKVPQIAWDIIQFHPSYGYEDFVRGIEVSTLKGEDGKSSAISYDTVNKTLGKIAEIACRKAYENTKFFLVIDEINRANLATVFGELIYGLEYRGKSVATPYTVDGSNKVVLPDNLYILGTMNTADKSIGGIDYAIRRRFLFFSLLPNKEIITTYNLSELTDEPSKEAQRITNESAVRLFEVVEKLFAPGNLNAEYYKDDVQIGHTYFLVTSKEQLYLRFKYQILPVLREYYKDGMFQIEQTDSENDAFGGLRACISGEININSEEERVKEIFNKLLADN